MLFTMDNSWLGLKGKSVIVTGGASGIGLACVREFLDDGAYVAVCDVNPQPPVIDAGENGGKYIYIHCDVTDSKSVSDMVNTVMNEFGTIDVLAHNAGITIPRLLVDPAGVQELTEQIWDKVMNVNVKGLFFCSQAVARIMVKKQSGVIINMSSESGLEGSEGQSVYSATKAAVNGLTRSWAKELGKHHVRVVGAAPGILEATGLRTIAYEEALSYTRGITVEQLRAGYSKTSTTPLGRSGKLSEVASTVAFLASDKAGYIHGTTINVAGGKTRG